MKIYITTISSNSYISGAVALKRSLISQNSIFPFRILAHRSLYSDLVRAGFEENELIVYDEHIHVPDAIAKANSKNDNDNWNYTFDKLLIFGLTEFEKIVFLDSDMMICKNIDELFDRPHMTAVNPSYGSSDYKRGFNSGLMVIEPRENLATEILSRIEDINCKITGAISDNDLLIEYYKDWGNASQSLDDRYNVFFPYVEKYIEAGLTIEDFKVIHFIGKEKEWMKKKTDISARLLELQEECSIAYKLLRKYLEFLEIV